MKKGLLYLLFPVILGGCTLFNKEIQKVEESPKVDTVYVQIPLNPLDTLKGNGAYEKAKEFFETAQTFYEEGLEDSSKKYFDKGTKLLSQSGLSLEDYKFIDLRGSLDNLEQYHSQKEAIENGIELSKEEIEKIEEKYPLGEKFAERVAYYEKIFQTKEKKIFLSSLERFLQYEPYLDSLLKERGRPEIIKYMYPIESGMNASAKSRVGAKGLAQFMDQTGKIYGLKIMGVWYDERLDPLKSIDASLDYIDFLISDFGDPHLAIASYNCGEGRVTNQLKRFNSFNFDELLEKKVLPRETLNHLPQIYAYKDLKEKTQIENPKKDPILENLLSGNFDTIYVRRQVGFKEMAKILEISKNDLKAYNPSYGMDATPPEKMVKGDYSFEIRIPKGKKDLFYEGIKKVKSYSFEGGSYIVEIGDTLWDISKKLGIPLSKLKKANGSPRIIKPGQKLIIPEK